MELHWHTEILLKTTLDTQAGIEVEDGKYVIANGQILQCQTSGDLTEFYVAVHASTNTPNTLTTYTAATWTDLVNNTSGGSQKIDLVSISNPSTTASVSVQLRITTSAGVLAIQFFQLQELNLQKDLRINLVDGYWLIPKTSSSIISYRMQMLWQQLRLIAKE